MNQIHFILLCMIVTMGAISCGFAVYFGVFVWKLVGHFKITRPFKSPDGFDNPEAG